MQYKQLLNELVESVIKQSGSDLHLSEGRHPTIRVSGDLIPLMQRPPLSKEDTEGLLQALVSEGRFDLFKEKQELDFAYAHNDGSRFRGNAFIQQGHIGIVLRLIPRSIKTLQELGLPPILEDLSLIHI